MSSIVDDIGYGRQFATWYDRLFPMNADVTATVGTLARFHPDPATGTLEFGVGTGRIAIPLSGKVGPVIGVDSSREMLDILVAAPRSREVTGVEGNIRDYTDTRSYGLVYAVCGTLSMLLTSEDQQAVICRAAERLRPGGRLVIETGNRPAVEALHEGLTRTTLFTPYPEPGTGLQTHSTLLSGTDLWQCSHVWHEADGSTRVGNELSRLTTPMEVDAYALAANLTPEAHYSNWELSPYTEQYPMFLATYLKST